MQFTQYDTILVSNCQSNQGNISPSKRKDIGPKGMMTMIPMDQCVSGKLTMQLPPRILAVTAITAASHSASTVLQGVWRAKAHHDSGRPQRAQTVLIYKQRVQMGQRAEWVSEPDSKSTRCFVEVSQHREHHTHTRFVNRTIVTID